MNRPYPAPSFSLRAWVSLAARFALLLTLLGCAPTLEPAIPAGYLAPGPAVPAGSLEARGNLDEWVIVLGRMEPSTPPWLGDAEARQRAWISAIRAAAARGIEAALVTATGEDAPWRDRAVARAAQEAGLILVGAQHVATEQGPEYTLTRSSGVDAQPSTAPAPEGADPSPIEVLMEQAHARGEAVILRHPCALEAEARTQLQAPAVLGALDAVEVDGPGFTDPHCARQLWQRWLGDGRRVVGLAASARRLVDPRPHGFLNLVRSSERTPEAVVRAIAAGHVQMVRQPSRRPRLHLGVDLDGDGRLLEARQGDLVSLEARTAAVQIRVIGGRGGVLLLYTERAQAPVRRLPVVENDEVHAFIYTAPAAGTGFLRAELYRHGELSVISNPIYLRGVAGPVDRGGVQRDAPGAPGAPR